MLSHTHWRTLRRSHPRTSPCGCVLLFGGPGLGSRVWRVSRERDARICTALSTRARILSPWRFHQWETLPQRCVCPHESTQWSTVNRSESEALLEIVSKQMRCCVLFHLPVLVIQADGFNHIIYMYSTRWVTAVFNSTDINECKMIHSLCTNGRCRNTIGSFRCRCDSGFALDFDERNCTGEIKDLMASAEMASVNIHSNHWSAQISMSVASLLTSVVTARVSIQLVIFSVSVYLDMRADSWWWRTAWVRCTHKHSHLFCCLQATWHERIESFVSSCVSDIDECERNPLLCRGGECINTEGSFRCECPEGHEIAPDGSACLGQCVF